MNTPALLSSFPGTPLKTAPTASPLHSSRGEQYCNHPRFQCVSKYGGYSDDEGNGISCDVSDIPYDPILLSPVYRYYSWYDMRSSDLTGYHAQGGTNFIAMLSPTAYFDKIVCSTLRTWTDDNGNPFIVENSKVMLYGPISGYLNQYQNTVGAGMLDVFNQDFNSQFKLNEYVVAHPNGCLRSSQRYVLGCMDKLEIKATYASDLGKWSLAAFVYDNQVT